MSLLDEYSDEFVIVNKTKVDDGYGGYTTVWTDGATISGALAPTSQNEVAIAGAMGEKTTHTLVVAKNIMLEYHEVLRRKSDGITFRVTNTDGGTYTPASAGLDLRRYRLEAWAIPTEVENG